VVIKSLICKIYGYEKDEDKSKLFAWIRYQCAYSYREGFDNGQDELKEQLADLLRPRR
jgi:hypothetical protein